MSDPATLPATCGGMPPVPASSFWELSTFHVAPDDLALVHGSDLLFATSYPEGAFARLGPDLSEPGGTETLAAEGFSAAFVAVAGAAVAAGVGLLRFDADGPRRPPLPDASAAWQRAERRAAASPAAVSPAKSHPHDFWTDACEERSRREGWLLTNDGRGLVAVARIDAPGDHPQRGYAEPKFRGDAEAAGHVLRRAAEGSPTHLLAAFLAGHPVGEPMEPPPRWLSGPPPGGPAGKPKRTAP